MASHFSPTPSSGSRPRLHHLLPDDPDVVRKTEARFALHAPAMTASRASAILRTFKFYQELDPKIQELIPSIVHSAVFPAGTVLFQHGDPSSDCYVVLSGAVGIYKNLEQTEKKESVKEPRPAEMTKSRKCSSLTMTLTLAPVAAVERSGPLSWLDEHPRAFRLTRSMSLPALGKVWVPFQALWEDTCRTAEGFSYHNQDANLGTCVVTIGANSLFGEAVLAGDTRRRASARCEKETQLLVIDKTNLQRVATEELTRIREEKLRFLDLHVPGMREVPAGKGRPHASSFFRKVSYPSGHVFLKQGETAEDMIFVLHKGAVEFRRRETVGPEPAECNRPSSKSLVALFRPGASLGSLGGGPAGGVRGGSGPQPRGMAWDAAANAGTPGSVFRKLGMLQPGGVFGTVSGLGEPEPFTVAAAACGAEVFCATAENMAKMPRRLVETLREYIARTTSWRLQQLVVNRSLDFQKYKDIPGTSMAWVSPFQIPRSKIEFISKMEHVSVQPVSPLRSSFASSPRSRSHAGARRGHHTKSLANVLEHAKAPGASHPHHVQARARTPASPPQALSSTSPTKTASPSTNFGSPAVLNDRLFTRVQTPAGATSPSGDGVVARPFSPAGMFGTAVNASEWPLALTSPTRSIRRSDQKGFTRSPGSLPSLQTGNLAIAH